MLKTRRCKEPKLTLDEYHIAKTDDSWKCKQCKSTKIASATCNLCNTFNKRFLKLQCSKCDGYYHKSCVRKLCAKYRCDEIDWCCQPCNKATAPLVNITQSEGSRKLPRVIRGHMNVQQLITKTTKKDDVLSLIHDSDFDIFGLSKTWLTSVTSDDEVHLDGYQIIRKHRPNIKSYRNRGGVIL